MAQYYNSLTFSDYPPAELLGSNIYEASIKSLSFQYRTKNENKLIAYIAVSQDRPNIKVPSVENQLNGCKILGIYAEKYQIGRYNRLPPNMNCPLRRPIWGNERNNPYNERLKRMTNRKITIIMADLIAYWQKL